MQSQEETSSLTTFYFILICCFIDKIDWARRYNEKNKIEYHQNRLKQKKKTPGVIQTRQKESNENGTSYHVFWSLFRLYVFLFFLLFSFRLTPRIIPIPDRSKTKIIVPQTRTKTELHTNTYGSLEENRWRATPDSLCHNVATMHLFHFVIRLKQIENLVGKRGKKAGEI